MLAGACGLLAAMFYAVQHPFQKPFVKQFDHDLTGALNIGVYGELILLVIFAAAWLLSSSVRQAFRTMASRKLMKTPVNRWNPQVPAFLATFILSFIAVLSGPIYSYSLQHMSTVLLSLILNLFPVYNLFIASFVGNVRTPKYAYVIALFGFATVTITQVTVESPTIDGTVSLILNFMIVSLIPILFGMRASLFSRWFALEIGTVPRVIVIAAFDAPVFILVLVTLLWLVGGHFEMPDEGMLKWSLFSFSVLASGILGAVFLQEAYRQAGSEQGWYPGLFFFLIPSMVMAFGSALAWCFPQLDETTFNWKYVPGAAIIGGVTIFIALNNRKIIHEKRKMDSTAVRRR